MQLACPGSFRRHCVSGRLHAALPQTNSSQPTRRLHRMCSRNHRSLFRLSMGAIIQGIDASSLDVTLGAGAILVCFEGPTVLGVLGVSLPSAAGTEVVVAGMPSPEGRTDVDSVAAVGDSGADVDVSTEAPPACSRHLHLRYPYQSKPLTPFASPSSLVRWLVRALRRFLILSGSSR